MLSHTVPPLRATLPHCSIMLFYMVPLFHHTVSLTVLHCSTTLFHSSTTPFHTVPPHCSTVPPHCYIVFHTIIRYYFLPWCFAASTSCDRELCYELITLVLRDYSMRTNLLELPNECFELFIKLTNQILLAART